LEKHAEKLAEYDNHLQTLDARNSYSKTDPSATFMRMKEDAMERHRAGMLPNPTVTVHSVAKVARCEVDASKLVVTGR
jgi:hypothetical protein